MDIHLMKKQGHSIRKIAVMMGMSRNTIRRVLRQKRALEFRSPERGSKLDQFKEYLNTRWQETGLSAVRLLEEIRTMGYQGSVQTLRRYLEGLKAPVKAAAKATVRYETPPGQQAQVDWKYCGRFANLQGQMISIYAFVMVLAYSRMIFVRLTRSMKLPALIQCHQEAFAFFGGWPQQILYDNMKQVRLSFSQWNPLLVDFANHYGIVAKTHRPYRPRTKGKVERSIRYLDDSFLTGREFADEADLQAQGLHWCTHTANVRLHATTKARPVDLWPQEKLQAIDSIRPYVLALPVDRQVDAESMVCFNKSRYSVAPEYVGKTVSVQATGGRITILAKDLIVAEHPESLKPGSSVVQPEHISALWKISTQRGSASPLPSWKMSFRQEVAITPLSFYEQEAA